MGRPPHLSYFSRTQWRFQHSRDRTLDVTLCRLGEPSLVRRVPRSRRTEKLKCFPMEIVMKSFLHIFRTEFRDIQRSLFF